MQYFLCIYNQPKAGENIFGRSWKEWKFCRRNLELGSWVPSLWTRKDLFTWTSQDKDRVWEDPWQNSYLILHSRKCAYTRQERSRDRSATVACANYLRSSSRDRVAWASARKETHLTLQSAWRVRVSFAAGVCLKPLTAEDEGLCCQLPSICTTQPLG